MVTTADLSGDEIPKRLKLGKNPENFLKKDKYINNKEMKFEQEILKKIKKKIKKK